MSNQATTKNPATPEGSMQAFDMNGREITIGSRISTYHPDTRERITVTVTGIDSRQDKPGNPTIVDYTTAEGEDKWEYSDSVEIR